MDGKTTRKEENRRQMFRRLFCLAVDVRHKCSVSRGVKKEVCNMHAHVIRKLPSLSILLLAVIANGIGHSHKLAQEAVFMQKSVKNCDEKMFSKLISTNTDAKNEEKRPR